jgi:UDP-4-amino-4,6-dideoxy-N-acetyl-beta-L-altrosamine N-acetyltransferase
MIQPKYNFKNFTTLNEDEIKLVWQWRNDEKIRGWMYNDQEILFENHLTFLQSLGKTRQKMYWMIYRNDQPLGVSSIVDIENDAGEWGYYLAPVLQGKSLGVEFFYHNLHFLFEMCGIETLYCYTLVVNQRANSLNDLFGFLKAEKTLTTNGEEKRYYFRELHKETWLSQIKTNTNIVRLLDLTAEK